MHLMKIFFFLRTWGARSALAGFASVAAAAWHNAPALALLLAAQLSGACRTALTAALGCKQPRREGVPAAGSSALCGARAKGAARRQSRQAETSVRYVTQNVHFV